MPPPAATIPIAPIIQSATYVPPTTTVLTAFVVPHTVIILPTSTLTDDSKGKPSNNIKVMPTI